LNSPLKSQHLTLTILFRKTYLRKFVDRIPALFVTKEAHKYLASEVSFEQSGVTPRLTIIMAISLTLQAADEPTHNPEFSTDRPNKRTKHDHADKSDNACNVGRDETTFVARHPLGVRPSGNSFDSEINLKFAMGSFARLPDELLASVLETLPPADLLRLGGTCRALYAFTRNEELWRALFIA
jgi:hypothetical protein